MTLDGTARGKQRGSSPGQVCPNSHVWPIPLGHCRGADPCRLRFPASCVSWLPARFGHWEAERRKKPRCWFLPSPCASGRALPAGTGSPSWLQTSPDEPSVHDPDSWALATPSPPFVPQAWRWDWLPGIASIWLISLLSSFIIWVTNCLD